MAATSSGRRTAERREARNPLSISEVVKLGARLSPLEDFQARTLSTLSGLWGKLVYMAELRSGDGKYQHWGHSKVHGEACSQAALARAHSELYIDLLRSPIREWAEELKNTGGGTDGDEFEAKLSDGRSGMIPENLEGGSPRHFSSVALAARLLEQDRRASSRSAA